MTGVPEPQTVALPCCEHCDEFCTWKYRHGLHDKVCPHCAVPESQQGEAARCPKCLGLNGVHGSVHVRHPAGGGGSNLPCPLGAPDPDRNEWDTTQGDCRNCGCPASRGHVYGERKCCPDCDHTPAVRDGAAGDVEALAEALSHSGALTAAMAYGVPPEAWQECRVSIAEDIAERLAEARAEEADRVSEEWAERLDRGIATGVREGRRQGAASVRARVEAMMRKAAHRVLSLHYSEPERFERETLRLAHDLSVQADELRAVASGGDES